MSVTAYLHFPTWPLNPNPPWDETGPRESCLKGSLRAVPFQGLTTRTLMHKRHTKNVSTTQRCPLCPLPPSSPSASRLGAPTSGIFIVRPLLNHSWRLDCSHSITERGCAEASVPLSLQKKGVSEEKPARELSGAELWHDGRLWSMCTFRGDRFMSRRDS